MDLSKTGERIKNQRLKLGMTQPTLAEKLNIRDKGSISNWEHGQPPKTINRFIELAEALECDPEYLLGCTDHPNVTTSWIAEQIPLTAEAIELLQGLKISSENSEEARFVSDIISFFIKALLNERCGSDGTSLVTALADLSFWYEEERMMQRNKGLQELLYHTKMKLRRNITANKEEIREASSRIFTEFSKSRPIKGLYDEEIAEDDLIAETIFDEMQSAYANKDTESLDELNQKLLERIFLNNSKEVDEYGEE